MRDDVLLALFDHNHAADHNMLKDMTKFDSFLSQWLNSIWRDCCLRAFNILAKSENMVLIGTMHPLSFIPAGRRSVKMVSETSSSSPQSYGVPDSNHIASESICWCFWIALVKTCGGAVITLLLSWNMSWTKTAHWVSELEEVEICMMLIVGKSTSVSIKMLEIETSEYCQLDICKILFVDMSGWWTRMANFPTSKCFNSIPRHGGCVAESRISYTNSLDPAS